MKLLVLGGSSCSTPALWSQLVDGWRVKPLHVILAGRDRARLEAVRRACLLMAPEQPECTIEQRILGDDAGDWSSLVDVSLVIVQIRNGGFAARSIDETFPLRYGVCGDEGLGPGGFAAALRNWPAVRSALARVAHFVPNAFVLMMSSPLGLLVKAARESFPGMRVAGICELPWATLLDVCAAVGARPEHITFDYFGVNHMGWLLRISAEGRDLIAEYAAARRAAASGFPSARLVEECEGVPLKYLHLHYERERALNDQVRQPRSRGQALAELSARLLHDYEHGDRASVLAAVAARPAPWYQHAVAPFVAAFSGRSIDVPFFLTVANEGFEAQFEHDDVLELAHDFRGGSLRRMPRSHPVPGHMQELIARLVRFERSATRAVLSGAVEDVEIAVGLHPWMERLSDLRPIAADIMVSSRAVGATAATA